ncbi:unnamed protein product [Ilex paraguariensis]
MNKLLGPQLCLDAKNSKDTNAAMLRWWSLLEKYSCKASKLHLKPRRFKIFVETLEHQLLKDRKKRKRPCQGENNSTGASTTVSNQGRASEHDTRAVKVVLVDSQNIQKLGSGKGSSLRRNVNMGINRSNCKGDSLPKTARHRRKTAAYKKWEKAAIAGVSLVADAAEHLERTTTDQLVEYVQGTQGQEGFDPIGKDVSNLPTFPHNLFLENNVQNSTKIKLQLFPMDEGTRRALEMDNHNPHLELTLSTRKKIASVLEHLSRKWGNSNIASGELMLFPYCVERKNLVNCRKWTKDSVLSAADVYALIGSPPVFRLRYGWFSNADLHSTTFQPPLVSSTLFDVNAASMDNTKEQNLDAIPVATPPTDHESEKRIAPYKDQLISATRIITLTPSSTDVPSEMAGCVSTGPSNNLSESTDQPETISWENMEAGSGAIMRQVENTDCLRKRKGAALSAGEWADSLTNISVGDLLSEASHNTNDNCINPPSSGSSQCIQQIPFSCDSFDAAIAAHIYKHQGKTGFQPPIASSIWDAEETCDAFAFQKNGVFCKEVQCGSRDASPEACKRIARMSLVASDADVEETPEAEESVDDNPADGKPMDECESDAHILDDSAKDLSGLTDIYWPDSLGPLNLDVPPCRYLSDDLIFSDSLSSLNRLIASSLDAFQNCSFFGLDKKEPASTVQAQETASFSDFKIGSEV